MDLTKNGNLEKMSPWIPPPMPSNLSWKAFGMGTKVSLKKKEKEEVMESCKPENSKSKKLKSLVKEGEGLGKEKSKMSSKKRK